MEQPPPAPEPQPQGQPETPPPLPETAPAPVAPPPPRTSLAARLLNVFAIPGEVFAEVKASPVSVGNWLVPALLLALVGVISAIVLFSQPAIQQQLRERQAKVMEQQVKAGKITQADADRAMAAVEKFSGPKMMIMFGSVGALFAGFARVLWWGFVLWALGQWFLKVKMDFAKTLEVAGLGLMIAVLGAIVSLLLMVNLSKLFATPSLALVVENFDETRKSHLLLGAVNLFSFWLVGVMGAGLGRLANVPWLRAAFLVCFYWVLQESLLIALGLGQFAL